MYACNSIYMYIYLYVPVHLSLSIYEDTLSNVYVSFFLGKPIDGILETQEILADFLGKGM